MKQLSAGIYSSRLVFVLGVVYALVVLAGLLSLPVPSAQISQPFLAIMEVLILLMAPLMAISMAAIHYATNPHRRLYSLASVCLMFIMAAITSGVHFAVLAMGNHNAMAQLPGYRYLFSFKWPSVVYALDILAWDWFFPLSFFFASALFRNAGLEKTIQLLMRASAALSLIGLCGLPTGNMQIRNIGIVGYAVVGPVVFLLIGVYLKRKARAQQDAE